jgi:hypothetical protein
MMDRTWFPLAILAKSDVFGKAKPRAGGYLAAR